MSSPNEPGYPGPLDSGANGANGVDGNGSGDRAGTAGSGRATSSGRPSDSTDVPPWQRGSSRTQQSGPARPVPQPDPPVRAESRAPSAPPVVENRVNRYVTGTAAPGALQAAQAPAPVTEVEATRIEAPRTKEYASELPDLSGPAPRPVPQRRASTEPAEAPTATANRPTNRIQVASRPKNGPVRATMQIRRVDPWSALKVSLLLSVALFFVWMIAVAFLYLVLGGMGVWSKLNSNVGDLLTSTSGSGGELVSSGTIFGGALLVGLVNIVLLTAMATIGAFIYNLTTDIVGGVEVTLADRD